MDQWPEISCTRTKQHFLCRPCFRDPLSSWPQFANILYFHKMTNIWTMNLLNLVISEPWLVPSFCVEVSGWEYFSLWSEFQFRIYNFSSGFKLLWDVSNKLCLRTKVSESVQERKSCVFPEKRLHQVASSLITTISETLVNYSSSSISAVL